ncbi:MAG: DHH family phosphoesterase [Candidatus Thorarchaeota archaeon]
MNDSDSSRPSKIGSCFSISHDKDVDGIASAAIVWRYAKKKGLTHDFTLTDYGSFDKAFSKTAELRNTLIIVTDLGLDNTSRNGVIANLSKAVSRGCRVVWLDHHRWPEQSIRSVLGLGNKPVLKINHDYCASEIAFKVLMPHDKISEELAVIAHDTDFNLREIEAANALTDAVSIIRFNALDKREEITSGLFPLVKALAEEGLAGLWDAERQRFKDDVLEQRVHHYRKEKTKRMRKALSGHCDLRVHGYLVRIVEMPNGVTSTDLGTYLANPDNLAIGDNKLPVADLLVTVGQGGKLGFRRGTERVLCDAAAKLFNGGGHPFAAGGDYGMYDDFEAVCDDIFATLSSNKDWIVEEPQESTASSQ